MKRRRVAIGCTEREQWVSPTNFASAPSGRTTASAIIVTDLVSQPSRRSDSSLHGLRRGSTITACWSPRSWLRWTSWTASWPT